MARSRSAAAWTTIDVVTSGAGSVSTLIFGAGNNVAPGQSSAPSSAAVVFEGAGLTTGTGAAIIESSSGFAFNGGGTGATAANTKGIMPYALAVDTTTGTATFATANSSSGAANTSTNAVRQLASTEEVTNSFATSTTNDYLSASTSVTGTNTASTVTVNSLTFTGGTQTLTVNPVQNFVNSSGGILVQAGSATITGGVLSDVFGTSPLTIWTYGSTATTLTISSVMSGGEAQANGDVAMLKAGAGTLILQSPLSDVIPGMGGNTMTGQVEIAQGTIKLNGGTNTLSFDNYLEISPGGTLDLNGTSQMVYALFTDGTVINGGGIVTNSSGTISNFIANYDDNAGRNFAGTITGNLNFERAGSIQTITFNSNNTYTGNTYLTGGTLNLTDSGQLSGTSQINLNYATLQLNNTGTMDMTGRVNSAAPIISLGGQIVYDGRAQTNSADSVGPVTVGAGLTTLQSVQGGTGVNSATLTIGGLTQNTSTSNTYGTDGTLLLSSNLGLIGSSIRILIGGSQSAVLNGTTTVSGLNTTGLMVGELVSGAGIPTGDTIATINGSTVTLNVAATSSGSAPLTFAATPASLTTAGIMVNNIIPWAISATNEFASYNQTYGFGQISQTGFAGYDFNAAVATSTTGLLPTWNIRSSGTIPSATTVSTTIPFFQIDTLTVNSLTMTGTLALNGNGVLNVASGGIIDDASSVNLGSSFNDGFVTAGGNLTSPTAGQNLYLYNRSGTLVVNASVVDNNPTYNPVATGNTPVTLVLTVNGGNITLAGVNTAYTGGTVVNAGTNNTAGTVFLGMNPAFLGSPYVIPAAGGLTINGATVTVATTGDNIDPATNVTLDLSGTLNMLGNSTLNNVVFKNDGGSPTNTQLALANTTAYMIGSVINSGGAPTAVNEVNDTVALTPITLPLGVLTITGSITSTSSNVGTVSTLAGRYILGASTTITGLTTATTTLSVGETVTGADIPAGATIASIINGSEITISAPATATTASENLTFGGFAMETGGISSTTTINVSPIMFNGVSVAPLEASLAIQGIVGGGFTLTGGGVLQLNAPDLYSGETIISGGSTLLLGVANAGSRFSQLDLLPGTFLNLAGASTTLGSLEGAGTVWNSLASTTTNGASTSTLTVGLDNTTTTFSGAFSRNNDATPADVSVTKVGTGTMYLTGTANLAAPSTTLTVASVTSGLTVGESVTGFGIPSGTTIQSISTTNSSITLSKTPTTGITSNETLTFGGKPDDHDGGQYGSADWHRFDRHADRGTRFRRVWRSHYGRRHGRIPDEHSDYGGHADAG